MTLAAWSYIVTFGPAALALSFLLGHLHGRWIARRKIKGQYEPFD